MPVDFLFSADIIGALTGEQPKLCITSTDTFTWLTVFRTKLTVATFTMEPWDMFVYKKKKKKKTDTFLSFCHLFPCFVSGSIQAQMRS